MMESSSGGRRRFLCSTSEIKLNISRSKTDFWHVFITMLRCWGLMWRLAAGNSDLWRCLEHYSCLNELNWNWDVLISCVCGCVTVGSLSVWHWKMETLFLWMWTCCWSRRPERRHRLSEGNVTLLLTCLCRYTLTEMCNTFCFVFSIVTSWSKRCESFSVHVK